MRRVYCIFFSRCGESTVYSLVGLESLLHILLLVQFTAYSFVGAVYCIFFCRCEESTAYSFVGAKSLLHIL